MSKESKKMLNSLRFTFQVWLSTLFLINSKYHINSKTVEDERGQTLPNAISMKQKTEREIEIIITKGEQNYHNFNNS